MGCCGYLVLVAIRNPDLTFGDHDGDYSLMYINLSERYYIYTSVLFPTWTKVMVMSVFGLGFDIVLSFV